MFDITMTILGGTLFAISGTQAAYRKDYVLLSACISGFCLSGEKLCRLIEERKEKCGQ